MPTRSPGGAPLLNQCYEDFFAYEARLEGAPLEYPQSGVIVEESGTRLFDEIARSRSCNSRVPAL